MLLLAGKAPHHSRPVNSALGPINMTIEIEYFGNWRTQTAAVRSRGGFSDISSRVRRLRCGRILSAAAALLCAVAAFGLKAYILVVPTAVATIWLTKQFYDTRTLGTLTATRTRKFLRSTEGISVKLTMSETGISLNHGGESTELRWSDVKSYCLVGSVLAIELQPTIWTAIPRTNGQIPPERIAEVLSFLAVKAIPRVASMRQRTHNAA